MPKYTQPRKTWRYTTDFKIKAVKLSQQDGLQVKQVAEGLDIHPFMLSRWRKEYREGKLQGDGQRRVGVVKKKRTVSMESFFHSLKAELIRGTHFGNLKALRRSLSDYINKFYNAVRLHSSLEYLSPMKYEQQSG